MSEHVRSIHIIDSPNPKDFYSERREAPVLQQLLGLRPDTRDVLTTVHTVVNGNMLVDAIDDVAQRIRSVLKWRAYLAAKTKGLAPTQTPTPVPEDDYYPVLHFACHGLENGEGIRLTSAEKLTWDVLRKVFRPIGKETGGKLLLCFSACGGMKAEQMLAEKPEVFDVLVAPTATLDPDEAVLGFAAFYHFFLTKGRTLKESVDYMNVVLVGNKGDVVFEFRPSALADKKFPTARRKDE